MNETKKQCRVCGTHLPPDYHLIGLCYKHVDLADEFSEEWDGEVDQQSLNFFMEGREQDE